MNTTTTSNTGKALAHLKNADPVMRRVIEQVGAYSLKPKGGRFELLVRSILSQQISVAAARTIRRRLVTALPGKRISANGIATLDDDQLQQIGISRQKRGYIRDLTQHVLNGTLNFRRLSRLPDGEVITELIQVKGIGVWTAQMFLIFGLGRSDIFPPDDLGIQNAIHALYSSKTRRKRQQLEDLAAVWAPYRSVASWYLWRSLEHSVVPET